jgi:hypothetical protein
MMLNGENRRAAGTWRDIQDRGRDRPFQVPIHDAEGRGLIHDSKVGHYGSSDRPAMRL